jgi:hypothetical protein
MTRDEAREILETVRPAGPVGGDSRVAEALRLAAQDPGLSQLLERQRAFDSALQAGIHAIPVPPGLRNAILAERKIIRPHFWQDWRTATAAAAASILLFVGGSVAINRSTAGFAAFRTELVAESWAGDPHLDIESTDLGQIRRWLARTNVASDFKLPAALSEVRVHGARVFEADGQQVALLCLADGAKHFHLFVLDRPQFSDLPADGVPDFEKCGAWKTTSWRQGNSVYVLTGMNYPAFVSKFRKAGRWSLSG